jgi:hypothetical protein
VGFFCGFLIETPNLFAFFSIVPRARQHFRQSDLVKALKALTKAGVQGRVEITPGKIVVVAGDRAQDEPPPTALDQWRRKRGQG